MPVNDANGGLFGNAFPYLNTPERGQQVGADDRLRPRAIAARAGLVLGIAAIVVAGGLLAGLRGGERSSTTQAAPSAVRATLDPVTSLTGDATQVSELQSRLQLHPANARLEGDLGIAYLQRARETNDPSYYTKAHDAARSLARSAIPAASTPRSAPARWRSPTTISARRCGSASAHSRSRTASRRRRSP